MVDGVQIVVTTYQIVLRHRRPRGVTPAPSGTKQFSIPALISALVGLIVLAHSIIYAGEVTLNIVLPQGAVVTDLKEYEFSCPKDTRCSMTPAVRRKTTRTFRSATHSAREYVAQTI
jgi:hypothetical protein